MGLWSNGRVTNVSHCDGGFEEARARVEALCGRRTKRLDGVAYLSVVPRADVCWRSDAAARGLPFVRITHRAVAALGTLTLDYPHPETIGADRLADAAAAVARYGAPVVVCDFGTAFTAAGFPLMRDYLYERTAKLPRMKLGGACPKIGRSTEEAMRFGALVGYRGMVREIVTTLARNFRTDFNLVATGGFAKWVLRDIGMPFVVDPTLTLHGAGLLAAAQLCAKTPANRKGTKG